MAEIMLVDDHDVLRASIREWLSEAFPECHFIEAPTGEDALAIAATHRPDIILMDISMNGLDGIRATRELTTLLPQTHVVILTVHDGSEYRTEAEAAG
ncbi:response regulator transcription factor [Candidatus Hydrogenedentota bacterium]